MKALLRYSEKESEIASKKTLQLSVATYWCCYQIQIVRIDELSQATTIFSQNQFEENVESKMQYWFQHFCQKEMLDLPGHIRLLSLRKSN